MGGVTNNKEGGGVVGCNSIHRLVSESVVCLLDRQKQWHVINGVVVVVVIIWAHNYFASVSNNYIGGMMIMFALQRSKTSNGWLRLNSVTWRSPALFIGVIVKTDRQGAWFDSGGWPVGAVIDCQWGRVEEKMEKLQSIEKFLNLEGNWRRNNERIFSSLKVGKGLIYCLVINLTHVTHEDPDWHEK